MYLDSLFIGWKKLRFPATVEINFDTLDWLLDMLHNIKDHRWAGIDDYTSMSLNSSWPWKQILQIFYLTGDMF